MSSFVSIQKIAGVGLDLHNLGVAAGYLGAAIGVVMVLPQIVRTLRDRTRLGVSALSWALTGLSCMTWMLYGVRTDEVPQIPGNVLMIIGCAVIVLAVPSSVGVTARVVRLVAAASVFVFLAVVLPAPVLGFVAFGVGLVSALPQLISSMLGRPGASGVSVLAWLLRALSQVAWLVYALVRHDAVVTISATFILASALLLVGVELRRRRAATSLVDAFAQGGVENVEARV